MPDKAIKTKQTKKPTNTVYNPHYSYQKTSAYDRKAIELLSKDPTLTPYQIGKQLRDSGKAKSLKHIYSRLTKSDYLRSEFAKIEQYHMEQLHRDTYPLATKRMNKALKNKDLDDSKVFPYVKLAYDKVHGETHKHVSSPTINIESVERLQVVMGADLERAAGAAK